MRWIYLAGALVFGACAMGSAGVGPIPEEEQAGRALKVIQAWRGGREAGARKKLKVVYYTPADREPEPRYRERLEAMVKDIQGFYRDGMEAAGFGPETFELERDASGKWVLSLVKGKLAETNFIAWEGRPGTGSPDGGVKAQEECKAAGISFDSETALIFCNLARWDAAARTFRHHSPYFGSWDQTSGLCFAVDSVILNVEDIPKNEEALDDQEYGEMSLGAFNSIFIGGIAHELGHAFSLPHCGERRDEAARGTSIMGAGNRTYREERRGAGKGSILTMASAMKLAGRPLFSGCDLEMAAEGVIETNFFRMTTAVTRQDLAERKGTMRVEGVARGTPPIYGVIAYFDSTRDEYHAPTGTSVPDAEGRYAIEMSDLAPGTNGQLRLEFCHANSAVSEAEAPFRVTPEGRVDLSEMAMLEALEPVGAAVASGNAARARAAQAKLESGDAAAETKEIGSKVVATLDVAAKASPAEAAGAREEMALGDARWESAEVGWLAPAANRLPASGEAASPFLDAGDVYATGLFAHSPSSYVFDLGGKWKRLRGASGLERGHAPYASGVVFVVKTDGREIWRSETIRGEAKTAYDLNMTGVKKLELVVEKTAAGNGCNWALWLGPRLEK